MFKSLVVLSLINSCSGVPFIFFNKKPAPPTITNRFTNKTDYRKIHINKYNNSLLITLMMYDLCTVYPNTIKNVYIKDKLA